MAFPLTRGQPVPRQILGMLLYSLVMLFSLVGCLLLATSAFPQHGNGPGGLYILMTCLLAFVLAPAATLLCGVLFGSGRRVLVSFISIYGGVELTHLLNPQFWGDLAPESFLFLLPVLAVIHVVGAAYEARKEQNATKSMLIMLAAAPILVFTFVTLTMDPNASLAWDEGGIGFCCLNLWFIPSWALFIVGAETIIQWVLSASGGERG